VYRKQGKKSICNQFQILDEIAQHIFIARSLTSDAEYNKNEDILYHSCSKT